jgi:signal transduction histidine kinase
MLNATVSHEMRGPISAISMNIEQLEVELKGIQKELDTFKKDMRNANRKNLSLGSEDFNKNQKFVKKCHKRLRDVGDIKGNI